MKQLWARYRGRLILALGVFLFGLYLSWSALFPPPVEFMTVPVTRQDIAETVLATGTQPYAVAIGDLDERGRPGLRPAQ